jgi:Sortilin, neurotensin receptor 3,
MRRSIVHAVRYSRAVLALSLCATVALAQGADSAAAGRGGRAGRAGRGAAAAGGGRAAAAAAVAAARDSAEINRSTNPLLQSVRLRSIGPASMGGRIDDIQVSESNPSIIYLGYAVGGVYRSVNNGTSFEPVFETYGSASIGAMAIHPTNPDIVYIGTGETNNRQTASFGDGLYKTTDGGKTFTHIGLRETQTISRIVIDPHNPEVVYVAAGGHLFGANAERGIYKTTDGGKSWNKIKFIDENTGFNDLVIDRSNPSVLYASSYERRRTSCCFNGGGPGSAIWKTTDGGKSWSKLSGNGLPPGTYGRIALSLYSKNPNVLYAQIEAGESGTPLGAGRGAVAAPTEGAAAPAGGAAGGAGGGGGGGGGGRGGYDWCNNASPAAIAAASAAGAEKSPELDAARGGVFRSENGGRTWKLMSNCDARPMYFSQLRVDPQNDNNIYVSGLPVAKSLDGGKTFATLDVAGGYGEPGHVDQHAIWIDPKNSNHIMEGNDGGFDVSWDQGKNWDFVSTMATGLAYFVTADMRRPYHVQFGLQDNNPWGGPSSVRTNRGILNSNWYLLGGGDGFQTAADPTNYNIVYTESQDGGTNRYDFKTGTQKSIRPVPMGGGAGRGAGAAAGASCVDGRAGGGGGRAGGGGGGGQGNTINSQPGDAYRFNWNTPFLLSPHDPNIIWYGGNRLFKSYNRGDTWVASADLTKQVDRCKVSVLGVAGTMAQLSKNDGLAAYSTIIAVSESPVIPGVVWAGTDDGNLQVSRDGAQTFTEVGRNLPGLPAGVLTNDNPFWISRVDASHFDVATAYVAVDGHRSDDLHPYIYVTHDYGKTFTSISNNLPASGNVQVIREDPKNKNLLYVGTEFGLFISLNGGQKWEPFMNNYPTVRTDDIYIHPRDGDAIIATHGRSIWIADDITALQQFTPAVAAADAFLFDIRPAVAYKNDYQASQQVGGQHVFIGENAPRGTAVSYYLKSGAGSVQVAISDAQGRALCRTEGAKTAGIHKVQWSLVTPLLGGAAGGGGGGGGGRAAGGAAPEPTCTAAQGGRGGGGGGRGGAGGLQPGSYTATLTVDGKVVATKPVVVLEDIWMGEK